MEKRGHDAPLLEAAVQPTLEQNDRSCAIAAIPSSELNGLGRREVAVLVSNFWTVTIWPAQFGRLERKWSLTDQHA